MDSRALVSSLRPPLGDGNWPYFNAGGELLLTPVLQSSLRAKRCMSHIFEITEWPLLADSVEKIGVASALQQKAENDRLRGC